VRSLGWWFLSLVLGVLASCSAGTNAPILAFPDASASSDAAVDGGMSDGAMTDAGRDAGDGGHDASDDDDDD
jgi:hypothetical protein